MFETLLKLLQDKEVKSCLKVKVVEVIATLIYRGYLYELNTEAKDSLQRIILD